MLNLLKSPLINLIDTAFPIYRYRDIVMLRHTPHYRRYIDPEDQKKKEQKIQRTGHNFKKENQL